MRDACSYVCKCAYVRAGGSCTRLKRRSGRNAKAITIRACRRIIWIQYIGFSPSRRRRRIMNADTERALGHSLITTITHNLRHRLVTHHIHSRVSIESVWYMGNFYFHLITAPRHITRRMGRILRFRLDAHHKYIWSGVGVEGWAPSIA